ITFHTENTTTPSAEERAHTKTTPHRTTQRHPKNTTRPGGGTQSAANRSHNTLTNTTP
ncbi:hypothetical protein GZ190_05275, partial [Dermatophilus congolensis]|nr:hypothetical protein [Dermatophilus congolensis]